MKDEKELQQFVDETRAALGDNLISVVLYGSHARGEASARSDVNLFMVVRDNGVEALRGLTARVPDWMKKGVTAPVVFRADQLTRSRDSFALEFLEMTAARKVLYGEDPFKDFVPDWETVRRELEREARQKRIALTRRWLASRGNARVLRTIISETVPGYLTLLRCTALLSDRQVVALTNEKVLTELADEPWFSTDVWRRLRAITTGQQTIADRELAALLAGYIEQAITLERALDEKWGG